MRKKRLISILRVINEVREKGGSLAKGNLHPSITFIKFWRAIHEELIFFRLPAFTLIIRPSASFCGMTSIKVRDMTECAYPYGWLDGWTINFINYDESHNSCLVASWLLQLLAGSCSIFFFPSPRRRHRAATAQPNAAVAEN